MILLYGAYGYTGVLIAERAQALGVRLLLGGRDAPKVEALAARTGHDARPFGLDDIDLSGVRAVLHAAGPFVRTGPPMMAACLAAKVPYVDITGEIPVFQAAQALDAEAKAAGVLLMPGAGFDVVPSDCLAKHVADALPGASHLRLSIALRAQTSHGTATTMVEHGARGKVWREGRVVDAPIGSLHGSAEFDDKRRPTLAVPWGDVATAPWSTGIANGEVLFAMPQSTVIAARFGGRMGTVLDWGWVKRIGQAVVDRRPAGPTAEVRAAGWARLVAEARHPDGRAVRARLRTPEGYTLTAATALDAAIRAERGEAPIGYHTPATAFGADHILGFEGCVREDAVAV